MNGLVRERLLRVLHDLLFAWARVLEFPALSKDILRLLVVVNHDAYMVIRRCMMRHEIS